MSTQQRIIVIGATGSVGKAAADTLESRGHDVVRASRSSDPAIDITDPASVEKFFSQIGEADAVIVTAGAVPFKHLTELTRDDYVSAFTSKTLGQIEVVRRALDVVADGGSITLTTGVISREPIAAGAAAGMANGALESFVITAAAEAPRGIRINAVSPNVLASSPGFHDAFPGQRPVTDEEVGRAYTLSVEGIVTGRTITT